MSIDSHCHLADSAFAEDLPAVVARAREAGVERAMCILSADELDEVARARVVQDAWPDVRFAAGVHPHRAAHFAGRAADAAAATRAALERVGGCAVGEIGLDYHYDFAPRDAQREVFAAQLALAGAMGRPVVIHTREASDDTYALLREASPRVAGVLHCFTGTREEARIGLDLGLHISLAGILTFPRAESLREIAAFVPADRLLVETDAPYLAPVPHRGKRNEPAWVTLTIERLALVRGELADEVAATVRRNFAALIGDGDNASSR